VGGGPLLGEHDVVMGGGAEAVGVGFLGGGVPELEEADGDVAEEGIDVAGPDGAEVVGPDEGGVGRLGAGVDDLGQFGGADDIDPVGAVDGLGVELGVVEEEAAEVVGEGDVAVEVEPPAVVLEAGEAGVEGGAFVEVAAVFLEEVGLDADRSVFTGDGLGAAVVMGGDDDQGVEVGVVEVEGDVEEVVEADAGGDALQPEGFGVDLGRGRGGKGIAGRGHGPSLRESGRRRRRSGEWGGWRRGGSGEPRLSFPPSWRFL